MPRRRTLRKKRMMRQRLVRRGTKWEQTHRQLLAQAIAIIRERGSRNLRVNGLMHRSGLTHGAFYAHFASRDALVSEALSEMLDAVDSLWTSFPQGFTPGSRLVAYVNYYLSEDHRDSLEGSCALPWLLPDLANLACDDRARFHSVFRQLALSIRAEMTRAGHSAAEENAPLLVSELASAVAISRTNPDRVWSSAFLRESREVVLGRLRSTLQMA
jgi:TetR/AcrR family transcriptional repressor of nem operon